jgi:molybdate transport system ATP-binding protein
MDGLHINIQKTLTGTRENFSVRAEMHFSGDQCTALFGPSGSGKTTLLRIIAGLDKPDNGTITCNGVSWFDSQKGVFVEPQKRGIGFVFQDYALFPTMSVQNNIAYGLPGKNGADVDQFLEIFDLFELRHRLPHMLSGGQKQRVALARACAQSPVVLLLDEPLSALDTTTRNSLQDELLTIRERMGITTILVSHDVAELFKLVDKVYTIQSGAVVSFGTPREVFQALDDRLTVKGKLLEKKMQGVVCMVTIAIGIEVSRVAISTQEAEDLQPGDMLCISVKAFNPQVSVLK